MVPSTIPVGFPVVPFTGQGRPPKGVFGESRVGRRAGPARVGGGFDPRVEFYASSLFFLLILPFCLLRCKGRSWGRQTVRKCSSAVRDPPAALKSSQNVGP